MTAEIHSLQAKIEGLGREACTRFLQPGTVPKAIELSITSRFIGLVLAVYDTLRSTWLSPLRLSRAVFVPLKHDGCTLRGLRRATSGLARTVATAAFRIFCSMAGVIAPEVVFNRLRLHEKLLRLGVYNRVQNVYLSVIPGAGVYGLEDRIIRRPSSDVIPSLQPQLSASVEDRVRQRVFEDVMGRVEEQQQRHMDGPLGWKLPLGRMLRESVLRALRLEFGVADPQPNPPPQAPPALVHQPHPAAVDDMYEDPFIQVFVDMDGVADPQPNPPPQALPILGHQPHRAAVNDVYEALLAQVIANANGGEWQVLPPDGDLFWETVPHSVPQWLQIFQGCLLDGERAF